MQRTVILKKRGYLKPHMIFSSKNDLAYQSKFRNKKSRDYQLQSSGIGGDHKADLVILKITFLFCSKKVFNCPLNPKKKSSKYKKKNVWQIHESQKKFFFSTKKHIFALLVKAICAYFNLRRRRNKKYLVTVTVDVVNSVKILNKVLLLVLF